MRTFNHCLATSRSGKSVLFRVTVNDRLGERMITLSSVTGWRADIAAKHLQFDSEEWNDVAVKTFVGLNALKAARDRREALRYIEIVRTVGGMETHFWASKFLSNENTAGAWRAFYRKR